MVDGNDAFTTTRRGALKTGALGLGGLTSAIALGGTEAASAAALPSMDTVAALAGVSGGSYFLQLDGIPGDSVDERHLAWIDVESYSWGASNSSAVSGSGWSSSKASISNLNLSTQFGSASPLLFLRTMNGKHVSTAVLQGMTGRDTPRKFLELELKDIAVISYQSSASEGPPLRIALAGVRDHQVHALPPECDRWGRRDHLGDVERAHRHRLGHLSPAVVTRRARGPTTRPRARRGPGCRAASSGSSASSRRTPARRGAGTTGACRRSARG